MPEHNGISETGAVAIKSGSPFNNGRNPLWDPPGLYVFWFFHGIVTSKDVWVSTGMRLDLAQVEIIFQISTIKPLFNSPVEKNPSFSTSGLSAFSKVENLIMAAYNFQPRPSKTILQLKIDNVLVAQIILPDVFR